MPSVRNSHSGFTRVRALSPVQDHLFWWFSAIVSGLLAPAIILLVGVIAHFFEEKELPVGSMPMGQLLSVPIPGWLSSMAPGSQLFVLVGFGLLLGLFQTLTIWISYRGVMYRSFEATDKLHFQMLRRMLARATDEGVATQRWKAEQMIEKALPQVHAGLVAWWGAMPRSIVLLSASILLALLIDPWLALLAVCIGLMVWRLFYMIGDENDEQTSSWEIPASRHHLLELLQQAPLLSRIQPSQGIDLEFGEQLRNLHSLHNRVSGRWMRTIPIIGLVSGIATGLLLLILGGHLLVEGNNLHLAAALLLILCVLLGIAASARLFALWKELSSAITAADAVFAFLDFQSSQPSSVLVGLPKIRRSVALRDVSMLDGLGGKLLDELTLELTPGTVTALIGSDQVAVQTLVELLLGCGRPASGRLTFDELEIGEIHPNSLAKQVIWVSQDGPLWQGAVESNLRAGTNATLDQLIEVSRLLGVYDAIQRLPEGFQTIIGSGDPRLDPIVHYGLGLARAILKQPSVAVLREPPRVSNQGHAAIHDEMIARAVKTLVGNHCIVVVLPQRIPSLKTAERVVLLHQGKVAGEGVHTQLLENNDVYRHLNYQLFNPYRQSTGEKK